MTGRFWVSVFVAVAASRAAAQSAGIVLQLPASARAAALGNTYSASGRDDAVIFYNPAQLAVAVGAGRSASASVQRYVAESNVAALSGAMRIGPGRVGLGLQLLDYGSEPEIVPDPTYGGERGAETGSRYSATDFVASAGYGVSLGRLRAGVTGKVIRQQLAWLSGSTGALDVGVALDVAGGTVAAVMQNSGGILTMGSSAMSLPLVYRGSAALPPIALGRLRMIETVELSQQRGGDLVPSAGAEIGMRAGDGVELAARVGLAPRRDAESSTSRITVGGGISTGRFALDYGYQTVEGLGLGTHRIGFRWWK